MVPTPVDFNFSHCGHRNIKQLGEGLVAFMLTMLSKYSFLVLDSFVLFLLSYPCFVLST